MSRLGYIMLGAGDGGNLALATLAADLLADGTQVCGCVQVNHQRSDRPKCEMVLQIVPSGECALISQDLGLYSRGCRLNVEALEKAVELTTAHYRPDIDLLLVNKFGKLETAGGGFRPLIAQAVLDGVPTLVGLNRLNRDAFLGFAGTIAEEVANDGVSHQAWLSSAVAR